MILRCINFLYLYYTIRYDTIEEFNVDSKAECGQLNLAHVVRLAGYKNFVGE